MGDFSQFLKEAVQPDKSSWGTDSPMYTNKKMKSKGGDLVTYYSLSDGTEMEVEASPLTGSGMSKHGLDNVYRLDFFPRDKKGSDRYVRTGSKSAANAMRSFNVATSVLLHLLKTKSFIDGVAVSGADDDLHDVYKKIAGGSAIKGLIKKHGYYMNNIKDYIVISKKEPRKNERLSDADREKLRKALGR
jgi:hypothetical protein